MGMIDKKTSYCLFLTMRAFGVSRELALEALFVIRGVTVKELSHRSDVSMQFVREWLRGRKRSRNLDRLAGELLFGDPGAVDGNHSMHRSRKASERG